MTDLLMAFYGDDFTGSTDAMEALALNGVPAALFLEPPSASQLTGRFAGLRAVGVAGTSRSMTVDQMEAELLPKFQALKALGVPLVHYKVCSTFDSSPTIGSIGRAADIGFEVFQPPVVPLIVGAPFLRRYVAFGNLFATVGDHTYRLDRHPTMSRHPITPMQESDLRLHLGQQTTRRIELIDLLTLEQGEKAVSDAFQSLWQANAEIILFDTLNYDHLRQAAHVIWSQRGDRPVFMVGSSGVEYALATYWQSIGLVQSPPPLQSPGPVDQLVVISGSASPVTAAQIDWSLANGFCGIRLDAPRLIDPQTSAAERESVVEQALRALGEGNSVLLYSAHGPDDPALEQTTGHLEALGLNPKSVGQRLGAQQGMILKALLERSGLRRACVAGGDTSGHAASQLGIYALEVAMPIEPGAPLCRASSHNPAYDGLEISLKGGQNGKPDYFGAIRQGRALHN
jgi:uncharacterized protein YgbK (DUF1537 family)